MGLCIVPNMKFNVQVRLLAENLSDQPESHSDKDKEVAYTLYDSFSDVGEIRVYFASKILTPCRMH